MKEFTPNENIIHFLTWIIDRDIVFNNKRKGKPFPWSDNEIINTHKFTNVFRMLDYESQFLIKHVIGDDKRDIVDTTFRILLFKLFNFAPTWLHLEKLIGDITYREGIIEEIKLVLDLYCTANKVFSSAYLQAANFVQQPEWKYLKGTGKHNAYLGMLQETLFTDDGLIKLINLADGDSLPKVVNYMHSIPGFGWFMALQLSQDLNYSHWYKQDMNTKTWEGPGSIRGVDRCFYGIKKNEYADVIKWTWENLEELFKKHSLGSPPKFKGLPLSIHDVQNCFCESDKYMRGLGVVVEGVKGKSIKQKYKIGKARMETDYVLPMNLR